MKIWHDDMRPPPDVSWVWARTNEDAKNLLVENKVSVISLDHDLGMEEVDLRGLDIDEQLDVAAAQQARSSETGLDLVNWMIETSLVPPVVRIHSWNPPGAQAMEARLRRYAPGTNVYRKAFGT